MASVIDLHIPDPPPVQNKTFPLKISGLNISIELAKGATTGLEDIGSTRDKYSDTTSHNAYGREMKNLIHYEKYACHNL